MDFDRLVRERLLSLGERTEFQSSSGIIISTGAGSTGWMRSVHRGAANIAHAFGAEIDMGLESWQLPWNTDRLVFAVREPFPSHVTVAVAQT